MKSILIIGLGRFGRHMSQKLIEQGNSVLAIDNNQERADNAVNILSDIQIGDSTDEMFMRSLGVNDFDLCVCAIADDFQAALETTVLLKDLGAKYILARACKQVHKKLLLRNGADHVVYAEREVAERLAMRYGAKNLFDYIELTNDVAIYEIAVPDNWVGKTIVEKGVRAKYNISILATKKDGVISPIPNPDHVFDKNETLMIIAEHNVAKNFIN